MTDGSEPSRTRIAILGCGFGGIGAAIRLRRAGICDFVVLERASELGGVWRDNVYPGCACDVESHLYSFSFAPNPQWSRSFSPQSEIRAYLERTATEHGILPHLRFGHPVTSAAWDGGARRWRIETTRGPISAAIVVMATGALGDPVLPDIPGLERFAGPSFYSSRWDHSVDLGGKRVAVIGTGASAVQLVPAIQPRVARLDLYQRTAAWVLPHRSRAITRFERMLFRQVPLDGLFMRFPTRRAQVAVWRCFAGVGTGGDLEQVVEDARARKVPPVRERRPQAAGWAVWSEIS